MRDRMPETFYPCVQATASWSSRARSCATPPAAWAQLRGPRPARCVACRPIQNLNPTNECQDNEPDMLANCTAMNPEITLGKRVPRNASTGSLTCGNPDEPWARYALLWVTAVLGPGPAALKP